MRIVVAGGSGLLGRHLTARLRREDHTVAVLTRRPSHAADVAWDPAVLDAPWASIVGAADAVINLAGESVAGRRWTSSRKAALVDSRLRATRGIAAAIRAAERKPRLFLSGSAIGIYGSRGEEPLTETSPPGSDFLATLCLRWEQEATAAADATRVVLLRTGVVLAREGGALPQMALPFRFFAGGPIGSGRQYVSWIHIVDWVEMVCWTLDASVSGPLNLTAPHPVTNREMATTIGRTLHRPALVPAPAFAVRLALGEMADVVVNGQRVLPAKATTAGFRFRHPQLNEALQSLVGRT